MSPEGQATTKNNLANNKLASNGNLTPEQYQLRSQTMEGRQRRNQPTSTATPRSTGGANRAATLPHSSSVPSNGFLGTSNRQTATCAGCQERILDGQALIALDLHWHVWCFKCAHCRAPLHGEYVAKEGKAYCEKDYQRLFGVSCVYCKRFITGKVLQAGEAHHFHPSCARCSKCGDPFVPGEEMYLQGEVTWHPRCGPGPDSGQPLDELDGGSRSQVSAVIPINNNKVLICFACKLLTSYPNVATCRFTAAQLARPIAQLIEPLALGQSL